MPPGTLLHCARNATVAGMRGRCAMAQTGGVTRLRARSVVRERREGADLFASIGSLTFAQAQPGRAASRGRNSHCGTALQVIASLREHRR